MILGIKKPSKLRTRHIKKTSARPRPKTPAFAAQPIKKPSKPRRQMQRPNNQPSIPLP
jgi:hypothetical protein